MNPNEASLFDAVYQAKLIDDRAQSVLFSLVRRIQPARKADKVQAAAIVDKCQDHLIALTKNTTIASVIGVAEASLLMKSSNGGAVYGQAYWNMNQGLGKLSQKDIAGRTGDIFL